MAYRCEEYGLRHRWFDNKLMDRVETLGIIAYRSEILLLNVIFGHDNSGSPSTLVGIWKSNAGGTLWDILTVESLPFPAMEVVAAYTERAA